MGTRITIKLTLQKHEIPESIFPCKGYTFQPGATPREFGYINSSPERASHDFAKLY
ncbi:MAG: hypothetical protein J7K96_08095 [Desulfobacteraceae bacterium]|nr:hypothetical protein [Desulfobacteraceae bacterium]